MTSTSLIIGIEGPAAAGKSTMAKTVAPEIGATVIEGGMWYRALTYAVQAEGLNASDTEELIERAKHLNLSLASTSTGETRISLAGKDVTDALYTEEVSTAIGPIAQNLAVRKVIDPQITEMVRKQGTVIMVGRHIKKLFPDAAVMHLTIDPEEADRRHEDRAGTAAQSVKERIAADKVTAKLLGSEGLSDATIDVTEMTQVEQADLLREFVKAHLG